MKLKGLLALGLLLALSVGAYYQHGFGKVVNVTASPQQVSLPAGQYVWSAGVLVSGTNTVYVMRNVSTNAFVLTNAIPVAAGASFSFGGVNNEVPITSLVLATESGESACFVAFD